MRFVRFTSAIVAVVVLAFVLRAGVLWFRSASLSDDRDAYIALADGLARGAGFVNSETGAPTAYRPPLYPLVLAGLFKIGFRNLAIAVLQLCTGTATVWLTYRIGRQLGLGVGALVAAFLVAIDPLLLQYTAFPMTETVFTFLLTAWLAVATRGSNGARLDRARRGQPVGFASDSRVTWRRRAAMGALFGLCALCRPTVWAVAGLAGLWWLRELIGKKNRERALQSMRGAAPMLIGIAVVVAPWLVRNIIVFNKPIVTTTHGGYTLILGNNPIFFQQVVEKPIGAVWEDAPPERSQAAWYQQLKRDMANQLGERASEPEQDGWIYRQAFQHISDDPANFLRACQLRFLRFWNVVPLGNARTGVPALAVWGVGAFYAIEIIGFVLGLCMMRRPDRYDWMPCVVVIVGFCLVHLVFWTDTRMRAPCIPAIALIFGLGIDRLSWWLRGAASTL